MRITDLTIEQLQALTFGLAYSLIVVANLIYLIFCYFRERLKYKDKVVERGIYYLGKYKSFTLIVKECGPEVNLIQVLSREKGKKKFDVIFSTMKYEKLNVESKNQAVNQAKSFIDSIQSK